MCDWSELGRDKLLVCADGKATTLDAQALCATAAAFDRS